MKLIFVVLGTVLFAGTAAAQCKLVLNPITGQFDCTGGPAGPTGPSGPSGPPGSGGSVFTGSTGTVIASSATPVFSLADVSVKSPIIFNISPTVNVTAPTITNTSAGARFDIRVTTDGTHTWSWNSIVSDNVCTIYTDAAATTTAHLLIDPDGTTIHGEGCDVAISGLLSYGAPVSAASTPPTSPNMIDLLTTHGVDILDSSSVHWGTVNLGINSAPGTCGDATDVCRVIVNAAGQVTSQSAVPITGVSGSSGLMAGYGGASVVAAGGHFYLSTAGATTNLGSGTFIAGANYTVTELYVQVAGTMSASASLVCTLTVAGTASSLVLTIPASSAAGFYTQTGSVAITAGQQYYTDCHNPGTATSSQVWTWGLF